MMNTFACVFKKNKKKRKKKTLQNVWFSKIESNVLVEILTDTLKIISPEIWIKEKAPHPD